MGIQHGHRPYNNTLVCVVHHRGAKLSTLEAVQDARVKAMFLIDPVDTTIYAPLSESAPPSSWHGCRGVGLHPASMGAV